VLLSALQACALDFNNTVLTLLYVDSDVILGFIMTACHNVFVLFSGMSCVPDDDGLLIKTCWTPPNETLSFKSYIEINWCTLCWSWLIYQTLCSSFPFLP
jgi:hypothetical protein